MICVTIIPNQTENINFSISDLSAAATKLEIEINRYTKKQDIAKNGKNKEINIPAIRRKNKQRWERNK